MPKNDLDEIESAIEEVNQKISEHKGKPIYKDNEQATILQLINPILESLGWDPKNPTNIHPEYNNVDLCLKKNGENKILIEAKSLEKSSDRRKPPRQLGEYCAEEGIKYGILTNGERWRIYTWEKEDKMFRKIWDLKLNEYDNEILKFYFKKLLKRNIEELQEEVSFKTKMDEIWEEGMRNIKEKIKEDKDISFYSYSSPGRKEFEKYLEKKVNELGLNYFKGEKYEPETINIDREKKYSGEMEINGEKIKLKENKYEVLHETVRWLMENGHLTEDDLPINIGKPENKENNETTMISLSSEDVKRCKPVKNVYVHCSMNRGKFRKESEWLLEELNLDHIDLKVIEWP